LSPTVKQDPAASPGAPPPPAADSNSRGSGGPPAGAIVGGVAAAAGAILFVFAAVVAYKHTLRKHMAAGLQGAAAGAADTAGAVTVTPAGSAAATLWSPTMMTPGPAPPAGPPAGVAPYAHRVGEAWRGPV
jgi:hypothetical protein